MYFLLHRNSLDKGNWISNIVDTEVSTKLMYVRWYCKPQPLTLVNCNFDMYEHVCVCEGVHLYV